MDKDRPEKVGGFLTDVRRRVRNNKNAIIIICGETGSGKSYSALRIAETLDKDFTMDRCVFDAESFMKLIKSGSLKKGAVILWDEVGLDLDARNFWSLKNKLISYTLESFRYMNLILLLTVPSLSFVDSKLRKLIHYLIETKKINYEKEVVISKVFLIQHSPRSQTGKVYQKFIQYSGAKLKYTHIGKPTSELIKDYERKRKKVLDAMIKDIAGELTNIKKKERAKRLGIDDIIEKVIKDYKKYTKTWGNREILDEYLISGNFGVGLDKSRRIKKMIEKRHGKKPFL